MSLVHSDFRAWKKSAIIKSLYSSAVLFCIKFDSHYRCLILHKDSRDLFSSIVFGLQAEAVSQSVSQSVVGRHPRDGAASCKSVWIQVAQRSWKCSDMAESSREPTEQSSLAQHQCLTLLLIMGIQGLSLTEKCSALFPQPPLSCWVLWNPIEVLLSLKIQYKSSLVLSQLGMSIF